MDSLTPSAIASYRDDRLRTAKPATVKLELNLLSRIIVLARREWGVPLPDNPISKIAMPRFVDARDRSLAPGDVGKLEAALAETRNPLVGPLVRIAIETGMRRGELLALEWRHVNIAARTARLPITKNGYPRVVPLSDGALAILESLPRQGDRVLPLTPMAVRLAWNRLRTRAGLQDLHFHDLRHEAISRFAELGLSTAELALISGHRDPRMLQRYTHLRPQDLAAKLAGRSWKTEFQPSVIPTQA